MRLTLNEAQALRSALADISFRNGFRAFVVSQVQFYTDKVVSEVRKSQPDIQIAAQHAGRMDAYEALFAELEHFVHNQDLSETHSD